MIRYRNQNGNSNIHAFAFGSGFIRVQFNDGSTYEYNNAVTGALNIMTMIALANQGYGLNSYINKNVRKRYSNKF